jgi:predicted dehydrogenase
VKSGAIGEVVSIDSAFTFTNSFENNYRLQPQMGGGSLLDTGPYQIHTWSAVLKDLSDFSIDRVDRNIGPTGIDLTTEVIGALSNGIKVNALTSFEKSDEQRLIITGNAASIEFHEGEAFTSWNKASSLRIGANEERFAPVDPFALMIESFGERIDGEPSWIPGIDESLNVAKVLDSIKAFPSRAR